MIDRDERKKKKGKRTGKSVASAFLWVGSSSCWDISEVRWGCSGPGKARMRRKERGNVDNAAAAADESIVDRSIVRLIAHCSRAGASIYRSVMAP